MENVSTTPQYGDGWKVLDRRNFTENEKAAIRSNAVVNSDYGKKVCFFLRSGGQTFIPLSPDSQYVNVGDSIDINTAKIVTLHKEWSGDIVRIEC